MRRLNFSGGSKLKLNITSFEAGLSERDDNILPFRYALETYNFDITGGNLKRGMGFSNFLSNFCEEGYLERFEEKFLALGRILGMWHYKRYDSEKCETDDKLIFINDNFQSYYINFNKSNINFNRVYSLAFTSLPVAVNYRLDGKDVIIFSSETDNMVVWDGENPAYSVLDAPKISSMALHYERLFATVTGEKNAVWFSDDLDPTNWSVSLDEAGFIQLLDERGSLENIISFNDYLYVFRKQGISRVTAYANQENFSVSHLFVSSSHIYKNTICVCGNRIWFLAADGLYKFDGYDTVKVMSFLDKRFARSGNENAVACYFNGKYYLACTLDFVTPCEGESEGGNNALLEIDVDKMTVNILRGASIYYLSSIVSDNFKGVLVSLNNEENSLVLLDDSGAFLGKPLTRLWRSPYSDLGRPASRKVIRQISLTTLHPLEVRVISEKNCQELFFEGSEAPATKDCFIDGERFRFEIISNAPDCEVSNVEIVVKVGG